MKIMIKKTKKKTKKIMVETFTLYAHQNYGLFYKNYVFIGTTKIGDKIIYLYAGNDWIKR